VMQMISLVGRVEGERVILFLQEEKVLRLEVEMSASRAEEMAIFCECAALEIRRTMEARGTV